MMTMRTVTNTGQPITDPSGSPLGGVVITATLVDCALRPCRVVDAVTGDVVVGTVATTTDSAGGFTLDLWPTSRGTTPSQYLIKIGDLVDFVILVEDLPAALFIFDAMKSGGLAPC